MYDLYIKTINIEEVRHLKNINIQIGEKSHLILTGKNGSGKTSVLDSLAKQLLFLTTESSIEDVRKKVLFYENLVEQQKEFENNENNKVQNITQLNKFRNKLNLAKSGLDVVYSMPENGIKAHFLDGEFIVAYYNATRKLAPDIPKHVEKVLLKNSYNINVDAKNEFVKYILDLKMTEALSKTSGKDEKAKKIEKWFYEFENVLKDIFEDDTTELIFDEDTFGFYIKMKNREPFDFNSLSDGYAAVMDIIVDLIIRMSKNSGAAFRFDMPGIVLIDEIETHLHLELQKKVMKFLTTLFPNVQFIISTHSPFILNSINNVVIYDLEKQLLIKDGLANIPYSGVVTGYFEVDDKSLELSNKYYNYLKLISKSSISDEDFAEIARLEADLDEIPDYLATGFTSEYNMKKLEFWNRYDKD